MVVGIKDACRLLGIVIISCCAVLVCTLFLNFNIDIAGIREAVTTREALALYDAEVSTGKVVSAVSGGCLLMTTAVMLLFYIKHYIDTHKKELGILKAMGYPSLKIARSFAVFGVSIFIGTGLGFGGAFALMPLFYDVQNDKGILPEIAIGFHPSLFLCMVILPTAGFALLAVGYACLRMNRPAMELLKENLRETKKVRYYREKENAPFMEGLRTGTLKSKKTLAFFILFSAFCFSAMTQMSFSMKDLASEMMAVMVITIGLVLACVTLFIAITTVVNGNRRTIAMMRVFGYTRTECSRALLGGYRPLACIGFAVGTVYQYVLLRLMIDIVFKDIAGVPTYEFDFPAMLISLGAFALLYEIVMYGCCKNLQRISIKEIMLE